jgi:hypothetical protein
VNVAGYRIQYDPGISAKVSGMTDGMGGFFIGPKGFSSPEELKKTLLQELYRLRTSKKADGVGSDIAKSETKDSSSFAEKFHELLK